MAWFAYYSQRSAWAPKTPEAAQKLLPTGTIQVQVKTTDCVVGHPILKLSAETPWSRMISFQLNDEGNPELCIATENHPVICARTDIAYRKALTDLLITYAWDAPRRSARLTVSGTGDFQGQTVVIKDPPPLFRSDLLALAAQVPGGPLNFVALSDTPEPIGPMPGIDPLTQIDTPTGPKRAGEIKSGDQIETDVGPQTVLARVSRTLPAVGLFAPIRLHAPFHGLQRHLTVVCHQKLVFGGADVEYAFGDDTVHIQAGMLETRRQPEFDAGLTIYCQFLLPKPAGILAQGALLDSLNIARLRRNRTDMALSILGNLPLELMPDHGDKVAANLPGYAAKALVGGSLR